MAETFDQKRQRLLKEDLFTPSTVAPDIVMKTTLVMEPNAHQGVQRVRVTARDEDFNLLWGANVSEGMLDPESPTEVGFYSALRLLIREHLPRVRPRFETTDDPYKSIERSLAAIREFCISIETATLKM